MNIQVDNREKKSRIASCVKFFTDEIYVPDDETYNGKGNTLTVQQLPIGDYIFNDNLCIEYKTAIDMIGSIMDGRVFKQMDRMKEFPYSYVIIVGDVSKEIDTYNQNKYFYRNQKKKPSFTVNSYLGAVARLSIMGKVIHVLNMSQGWQLMWSLANKVDTNQEYLHTPEKLDNPVASFLTSIEVSKNKRLSKNKALLITKRLNLKCLRDLLNVDYDRLVEINGVGSKTAYKILEAI